MNDLNKKIDELKSLILINNVLSKTVFDIQEASIFTGYTVSTLYTYCHHGYIPYYKPRGKKLFFKKEELTEWLLQNKHKSNYELDIEADNYLFVQNDNLSKHSNASTKQFPNPLKLKDDE